MGPGVTWVPGSGLESMYPTTLTPIPCFPDDPAHRGVMQSEVLRYLLIAVPPGVVYGQNALVSIGYLAEQFLDGWNGMTFLDFRNACH